MMVDNRSVTEMEEKIRKLQGLVDEQRKKIEELNKKQEAFNILCHAQPATAILLEKNGKILAINKALAKSLNRNYRDIIGSSILDYLPSEGAATRREKYLEVLNTGKSISFQDERNGRIYENNFYPIYDKNGEITAIAVYVRDITESVNLEKVLKKEITQRGILIERSWDGIVLLDRNGKVYEANKRYADMLGYSPEEIMDLHIWDWDAQWTKEQLKEIISSVDTGGTIFETKHRRKDGTYYDVEISVNSSIIDREKLIFCVCRDITERKQAENALKEAYNIINRSPVVAFLWQNKERMPVEFVSDNVEKILGYPAEEFIAGRILFADLIYPEDKARVRREIQIKKSDRQCMEISHEPYRVIDREGSVKWIENMTFIRRDDDGNVTHFQGIIMDISKRIDAEEERKIIEHRLRQAQKMEAIGMLAGGVAHDLNNTLTAIVSYPELILMDLPDESHLIKPVKTIKNAGERAAIIVQDLLTLAKRGVAINEVLDLNQVISDQLTGPEIDNLKLVYKDVEIETKLAEDLFNIKGSSAHLSKTVMNLISNAAEAMPGGGKIFIETKNQYIDSPLKGYDKVEEGDYVVVTVSDKGIGISDEDMKYIFEPFYTKKVMGRSGTGLGMAVVWNTVKDHKGYIDIESYEGKGTTFKLFFPVTEEEIIRERSRIPIEEYTGNGESLLVCDDISEQREIASTMLTKLGYSVETVAGGEEAIEYLKTREVDLLILDMIMDPGIDGLDTYKKIIEIRPDQRTIIVSGFSETERVKEIQRLGGGQYIKKPYTLEKLGLAVQNELDRK